MSQDPCTKIHTLYPTFSKVESRIADFILSDPLRVTELSVQSIAAEIDVAESSIVRFCRTIGYSGLKELKYYLIHQETSFTTPTIFEDLSEKDNIHTIAEKIFALNIQTIQRALQSLDYELLDKAVSLLASAEKIYIYGFGASASLADDFYVRLMRVGVNASSITDSHLCQIASGLMNETDVVLAISHTGRSKDLLWALDIAQKSGAKIVSITGYAKMPIAKISDVCLELYSPSQLFVSPRVAQVTILACLYVCLRIKNKDHVIMSLQSMEQVLAPMKEKL